MPISTSYQLADQAKNQPMENPIFLAIAACQP